MTDKPEHECEIDSYSDPPLPEFTDDHVFPEFLSVDDRSVCVCRSCNRMFNLACPRTRAASALRLYHEDGFLEILEIDHGAQVSRSEEGAYVQAWGWDSKVDVPCE